MTTTASNGVRSWARRVVVVGRLLAAAAVLLAAGLAWSARGWSADPYDRVDPVGADRLLVTWTGGSCDRAWHVAVDESDAAVRLTVMTQVTAFACDDAGVGRSATVRLDAPLAGRAVVNAPCERGELADRTACRGGHRDDGIG